MVHTRPPWSSKWRMIKVFEQIDSGELAARLGSPSVQDRRGNVLWMENFESTPLQWDVFRSSTGCAAEIMADKYWMGSQSCKLTAGSVTNTYTYINKYFSLPQIAKFGIEVMSLFEDAKFYLSMYLDGHTGSAQIRAGIRYNLDTDKLYYHDSGGGWTEFQDDVSYTLDKEWWLYLKMVLDWSTGKYIRAIVGGTEYDLSSYSYKSTPGDADAYIELRFLVMTLEDADNSCYIDNVIITQNEP